MLQGAGQRFLCRALGISRAEPPGSGREGRHQSPVLVCGIPRRRLGESLSLDGRNSLRAHATGPFSRMPIRNAKTVTDEFALWAHPGRFDLARSRMCEERSAGAPHCNGMAHGSSPAFDRVLLV